MSPLEILGHAAISTAGRDKGRYFLVVGVADEAHVLLCDGSLRKMMQPKKKKYRHVKILYSRDEAIAAKLLHGEQVFDVEVRKSLVCMGYNNNNNIEEG